MKKIFLFSAFFFLVGMSFAQEMKPAPLFNSTWSEKDKAELEQGKIVIRNIQRMKKASIIKNANPFVDEMLNNFTQMDPVYLAEIIYKMPKEGNENIYEQAVKIFEDVMLYKEIIYTDERKGKSRPLFPTTILREREDQPGKIRIGTHLQMDMLSDYDSELVIKYSDNGFFFEQRNLDPLKWRGFTAVKAEKMIAGICCFEYDGSYYVYALGGIRAPRIPLVLNEIDRQFIGRIEDFTIFYIERFDIKR